MANLLYGNQYFTTQLNVGGGIDASQTTGIIISDVSGVDTTKPGIALVNYSEPLNTTLCEWIEYSSINGSKELQGVIRGSEGFSAKSHDNEVTVAFPVSESHINRINNKLLGLDTGVILDQPQIKPRTTTEASSATPTINTDNTDMHTITALAADITSFTTNLSGTPVNGQKLIIRILDDGTARAITWGASFASRGATLPTTTTLSKITYVFLVWNSITSTWDCVNTVTEDSSSSGSSFLGYAAITSNFTTSSTGDVDVTGLTTTVNVPSGAKVKVTLFIGSMNCSASGVKSLKAILKDGSTAINESSYNYGTANSTYNYLFTVLYYGTPSAGSHTYKATVNQDAAGTITLTAGSSKPSFILVETV